MTRRAAALAASVSLALAPATALSPSSLRAQSTPAPRPPVPLGTRVRITLSRPHPPESRLRFVGALDAWTASTLTVRSERGPSWTLERSGIRSFERSVGGKAEPARGFLIGGLVGGAIGAIVGALSTGDCPNDGYSYPPTRDECSESAIGAGIAIGFLGGGLLGTAVSFAAPREEWKGVPYSLWFR